MENMEFILDLLYLGIIIIIIASIWKIFTKAAQPGWASIIPIYNILKLLEIVGRPLWWIFIFLIPVIGIIAHFIVSIDLAKSFGKGTGFGVGMVLLPFIFLPILAFGDAEYQGPAAKTNA
jgi:hypothetical protein